MKCAVDKLVMLALWVMLTNIAACSGSEEDACDGVSCSGHGICSLKNEQAQCDCYDGYHAEGLNCVEDGTGDPCQGVSCSGHGTCVEEQEQASCDCDEGYHADGLSCVKNNPEDPCDGVVCSGHGTCVEEDDQAYCDCDEGYRPEGLTCVAASWPLWPLPVACAEPTAQLISNIPVNTEHLLGSVSLAWAWDESEAAVAYTEPLADSYVVKLQRLSAEGQTIGEPITLASEQGFHVALTSTGDRYVACWHDASAEEISCSRIPTVEGEATPGLTVSGMKPAVGFGLSGLVLVYSSDNGIVVQSLDEEANAQGTAVEIATGSVTLTAIEPTQSGYAVAAGGYSYEHSVKLYLLDTDLKLQGDPITLAPEPGAKNVALAAAGDDVGVFLCEASQVSSMIVDSGGTLSEKLRIDSPDASFTYGPLSAASGVDSYAATWSAFDGYIGYRALDAEGTPLAEVQQTADTGWNDNPIALVEVEDGFLMAVSVGVFLDPILEIHHLVCQ